MHDCPDRVSHSRAASLSGVGVDYEQVLDQEELIAMRKSRGIFGHPVVGAAPRRERHLARFVLAERR